MLYNGRSMDSRQEKLLQTIVAEYVKTALPVGSKLLTEKYDFDVSPATIRNEMMALEAAGYIAQPHTSAGRVPTALGYQYYVDRFLSAKEPSATTQKRLSEAAADIKQLARQLAEESGLSVFVSFSPYDSYYTGLSNLFAQPEFASQAVIYNVSRVVDHLDDVTAKLFHQIAETTILIGKKNPFGEVCATVVTDYQQKDARGIVGLLGPMRLDYDNAVGLLAYARGLIHKV